MRSPKKIKRFKHKGDFVTFKPAEEDIVMAYKRSIAMGILPGSYTRGAGNMVGCLGEVAVSHYLRNSEYVGDSCFTHDILHKKKRIDVKSKSCSSKPKQHYSAFVNCKFGFIPENDAYFFTRVKKDLSVVYLVGWVESSQLQNKSIFRDKGDIDPDGFVFRSSGYQFLIQDLNKPKGLK